MFRGRANPCLMLLVLCAACGRANAIPDEIQVYTDEVNAPGEYGLETHVNTTPRGRKTPDYPGDLPPYRSVRITPEFSRGLTQSMDVGLYLPTAIDADDKLHAGSYKVRLKWIPVRADERGWYFGTNHELSWLKPHYSESRREYEIRLIGGYKTKDWLVGANAILGWGLTPGYRGSPDTTVALKAARAVSSGLSMGAEYYQDMGTWANHLPRDFQPRTLYMIVDLERPKWGLNFGVGHGLTPATDNWTLKAILGYSFN